MKNRYTPVNPSFDMLFMNMFDVDLLVPFAGHGTRRGSRTMVRVE